MLTKPIIKAIAAIVVIGATWQPAQGAGSPRSAAQTANHGTANAADDAGDGDSRAARAGQSLVGQPAPAATLTTIDGQRIDLGALYGKKPVYLKFWATWCVPCREQMPGFERLYRQYGSRIAVVAVNVGFNETEAGVRAYRVQHGLHMPIVIDDGSLGRSLNLRVTPQHILIDTNGRIAYVGHKADRQLDDALERAVSEKPAARAVALAPQLTARAAFKVGDAVRGIAVTTIDGKSVALADGVQGKPRALMFFSPWCESYLRESRPATAHACRRMRLEAETLASLPGVEWLGISAPVWASASELADYAKTKKTSIPLALDRKGDIFGAFGIRQIPALVLIDANGRVAKVLGPYDTGIAQAVRALAAR
jgi:peroxiredoxin